MTVQTIPGFGPDTGGGGDAGYRKCEKSDCRAPLEKLVLGGVGDWSSTILCGRCFHTRRGVPLAIINSLAAERYGLTVAQCAEAYQRAQAQYEAALVDEKSRFYIPVSYEGGLPLLERWRRAYQNGDAP